MASLDTSDTESTSGSDAESSSGGNTDPWESRDAQSINDHSVTLRRELDVSRSQANRERAFINRRKTLLGQYDLEDARAPSIVNTNEARDLRRWCVENSWCFCEKCGHLGFQKLLPSFRNSPPSPIDRKCKCGGGVYHVPQVEDVPVLLRNLTKDDIRVLRPFDIHCGDYKRVVHGYRQRTGTFRVSWSALLVREKIQAIEDLARRRSLQKTFNFLMAKADSSYWKFVLMQSRGVAQPFPYEIFSAPSSRALNAHSGPLSTTPTLSVRV